MHNGSKRSHPDCIYVLIPIQNIKFTLYPRYIFVQVNNSLPYYPTYYKAPLTRLSLEKWQGVAQSPRVPRLQPKVEQFPAESIRSNVIWVAVTRDIDEEKNKNVRPQFSRRNDAGESGCFLISGKLKNGKRAK